MGARKKALFVLFSFLSYCINSLTVSQHLVHAALRIFPPHTSIDIIISFFMVSVDGKETASIAVKSPHVSLWRLAKPAAKVGRHRMQNPRSPGDTPAGLYYTRGSGFRTNGWAATGRRKESGNERREIKLLAYAGSRKRTRPTRVHSSSSARLAAHTKAPLHPPFQHRQGLSIAVDYSIHFFSIF